jgi:DNA polymerase
MSERRALLDLVCATRAQLEWLRDSGHAFVDTATLTAPSVAPVVAADDVSAPSQESAPAATTPVERTGPRVAAEDLFADPGVRDAATLEALRTAIGDCQRCKLAQHRTHIVFGVGNPTAELVFVGEAPGHDEDRQGEPFVGRAGQLLTDIIVKGMRLRREDVYIANIIKCRPPQNRNPEADEIAACEPFLIRQLEILRPRVIVALGSFAAQALLRTRTPISRLRGIWADYHGIPLMPTFHPAYLLRTPSDKRIVWQDIQAVMEKLGIVR